MSILYREYDANNYLLTGLEELRLDDDILSLLAKIPHYKLDKNILLIQKEKMLEISNLLNKKGIKYVKTSLYTETVKTLECEHIDEFLDPEFIKHH